MNYSQLIGFMRELRKFFHKQYGTQFKLGKIYQGDPNYSYFSLTTEELKKVKLKLVIILNHKLMQVEICLSGQNKEVRKNYWKFFKGSDWDKYHLAESIDKSLSIIDHTIIKKPDFNDKKNLIKEIEKESFIFINELLIVLETK